MNLILAIHRLKKFFAVPAAALLPLLLVPARPAAASDTLRVTLEELIEHALSSSPRILAAEKSVEQAEGHQLASLAGFLPHLKVSEVFSRGNDPVFAFGTKLRQSRFTQADFSFPQLNEPSALTNYATRFIIEQPIFNGGKSFYGRRQATAYRNAADHASQVVREQTLFDIRQAYYSLILTRENLKVIDAALAAARSHHHQAAQMLETGMVTLADELKASVRVSEFEQQRIKAPGFVAFFRARHAAGWSDSEIAAAFGADRHAVSGLRRRLGLPSNARSGRVRKKIADAMRQQCRREGVKNLAALRVKVFSQRARAAGWPEDLRPRAVQMLNLLWERGPQTRRQIAEAISMPWRGSRKSLVSNDPEGSYLAHLMRRGLVVSLGRVVKGAGRGRSVHLYSLPLSIERTERKVSHAG